MQKFTVDSLLSHDQQQEIINWYLQNGQLIWAYKPAAVRLWADGHGFGIEFKIAGHGKWWADGDINDETVVYFNNYQEWRSYASKIETVDVESLAAEFVKFNDFLDLKPHLWGFEQSWVLHPFADGIGVIYDRRDKYAENPDWRAVGAELRDLCARGTVPDDFWEPLGIFSSLKRVWEHG